MNNIFKCNITSSKKLLTSFAIVIILSIIYVVCGKSSATHMYPKEITAFSFT